MELIINISEERYKEIVESDKPVMIYRSDVAKVLVNGTPLPKKHGAIVDLKQVIRVEIEELHTGKKMVWNNNPKINNTTWRIVTPTIIEANKKGE